VQVPYGTNVFQYMPRSTPTSHFAGCNGCPSGWCTCTGNYFITTDEDNNGYETDSWTGILESPEFTLSADSYISYGIGGGSHSASTLNPNSPSGSACALTLEVKSGASWSIAVHDTGSNNDVITKRTWSAGTLHPYAGQTVRMRIYDLNTGGWGHIAIDDITISAALTPTPTPTASAIGDPHMQNIYGQRFDLMRPGKVMLINIPRGSVGKDALLAVEADARRLSRHCADMYFQQVNITGAWADKTESGGFFYDALTEREPRARWDKFGPVELKVVHGLTNSGIRYLNLFVKHLGQTGLAVGGLLGEDDHTEAATPTQDCRNTLSLNAATHSDGVSRVEVSVATASSY